MGAVRYPRLHISLPVRHGTDAATLEKSAGHLYGTSLPVGDESTHAVVAAHRGLADRLMFTNLGLAKKGDLFEIDVQGERLRYKVTDIRVNGPDDVKPLAVEKGRDLVTLYTCTPYGVNTQRLLVVFCQVGVGRFGVSFSPCERRVSGRFGVGRSCWLLVIALVIA